MATNDKSEQGPSAAQKALLGAAVAAGAAALFFVRRNADMSDDDARISDAPDHVLRDRDKSKHALVGKTVTVGKPRQELYDFWRDFTRFPQFMDNVESVEKLDGERSRWTIKGPAGSDVELVTRITDDRAGAAIAWVSEPESDIKTDGRVEFADAGPERGTTVRLIMRYEPPGGMLGRGIAKLLQREPQVQARRDLRRFKQLVETGEVTTNASPSGRGEDPSKPRL